MVSVPDEPGAQEDWEETEERLPGLHAISMVLRWFEELANTIAGPFLQAGMAVALIDLLTDGELTANNHPVFWGWAISQAVGIDVQVTGTFARAKRALQQRRAWAMIGLLSLGLLLMAVAGIAAFVFSAEKSQHISAGTALASIHITPTAWLYLRAGLSVSLVALSAWTRYHKPSARAQRLSGEQKHRAEVDRLRREAELAPLRRNLRTVQAVGAVQVARAVAKAAVTRQATPTTADEWEAAAKVAPDTKTATPQTDKRDPRPGRPVISQPNHPGDDYTDPDDDPRGGGPGGGTRRSGSWDDDPYGYPLAPSQNGHNRNGTRAEARAEGGTATLVDRPRKGSKSRDKRREWDAEREAKGAPVVVVSSNKPRYDLDMPRDKAEWLRATWKQVGAALLDAQGRMGPQALKRAIDKAMLTQFGRHRLLDARFQVVHIPFENARGILIAWLKARNLPTDPASVNDEQYADMPQLNADASGAPLGDREGFDTQEMDLDDLSAEIAFQTRQDEAGAHLPRQEMGDYLDDQEAV